MDTSLRPAVEADGSGVAAVAPTAAGTTTAVDDYDDFNSFLDTVLSDCDEAEATPAMPAVESEGKEDAKEPVIQLEDGTRGSEDGGEKVCATAGDEIAGVPLTPVAMDSTSTTGVVCEQVDMSYCSLCAYDSIFLRSGILIFSMTTCVDVVIMYVNLVSGHGNHVHPP